MARFLAYAGAGDKPTAMGNATPRHRERDEFDIVLYVILGLVGIAVVMGLIEWNARRNAAAITREMFRPPTPAEARAIEQTLQSMEAESAREVAKVTRRSTYPTPTRSRKPPRDLTPLAENERCISGQRFRRGREARAASAPEREAKARRNAQAEFKKLAAALRDCR